MSFLGDSLVSGRAEWGGWNEILVGVFGPEGISCPGSWWNQEPGHPRAQGRGSMGFVSFFSSSSSGSAHPAWLQQLVGRGSESSQWEWSRADFIGTFLKKATRFYCKATGSSGRSGTGGRRGNEVILQYWFAYMIEDISNIKYKKQKATVFWIHPVSLRKTCANISNPDMGPNFKTMKI